MSAAETLEIANFLRRTADAYERAAGGTPTAADHQQVRRFVRWIESCATETRHQ